MPWSLIYSQDFLGVSPLPRIEIQQTNPEIVIFASSTTTGREGRDAAYLRPFIPLADAPIDWLQIAPTEKLLMGKGLLIKVDEPVWFARIQPVRWITQIQIKIWLR
jgi:hypothetical protein